MHRKVIYCRGLAACAADPGDLSVKQSHLVKASPLPPAPWRQSISYLEKQLLCCTESPILCLLKRFLPRKKYRTERSPFFLVFGARASIHTLNVAHVAVDSVYILVDFRYIVGGPPIEAAGGRPRRLRDDCVMISNGFGLLFWGALGITFGVI